MTIRLNITMDEDLYRRLKSELPPKKISSFINEAVRARLRPDRRALDAGYKAARSDPARAELEHDWEATSGERWPE